MKSRRPDLRILVLSALALFGTTIGGRTDSRLLTKEEANLAASIAQKVTPPGAVSARAYLDTLIVTTSVRTLEKHPKKLENDKFALVEMYRYRDGGIILRVVDLIRKRVIGEEVFSNITPPLSENEKSWVGELFEASEEVNKIEVLNPNDPNEKLTIGGFISRGNAYEIFARAVPSMNKNVDGGRPERLASVELWVDGRLVPLGGTLLVNLADESPLFTLERF